MERRNILRKTNKPEVAKAPEAKVINEEETFEKQEKPEEEEDDVEVEVENQIDPPVVKEKKTRRSKNGIIEIKKREIGSTDKYADLAAKKAKALETRRRNKEEKMRLKIQQEELIKQLQQQKEENERLRNVSPQKEVKTKPRAKKVVVVEPSSDEEEEEEEQEQEEEYIVVPKKAKAKPKKAKEAPAPPVIDYDFLAQTIYGKFSHIETGIREEERMLAEKKYKEELKAYEDKRVVERQRAPLYTAQRKKPNRQFEAVTTGYWGR